MSGESSTSSSVPKKAHAMFGVGVLMDSAVLPWKTLDNDSWYQLLELGLGPDIPVLGKGHNRLTPWHNHFFGEDGSVSH